MSREFRMAACVWHDSSSQVSVGWLRLAGSLKLKVSCAKEPFTRDHILQKRSKTLCHYSCEYESCHSMSRVTEFWRRRVCDTTHSSMWRVSFIHVTRLIHPWRVCDTTHSSMWHVSFIHVTRLNHPWRVCDTTHSSMWHVAFIHVTRLIHPWRVCDMTHSSMWHVPFIYVTRLIHPCHMTHPSTWCASSTSVTRLILTSMSWVKGGMCVTWLIHFCDMTHSFMSHDSSIYLTRQIDGWVAKIHTMPYLCRSLSAKEPYD